MNKSKRKSATVFSRDEIGVEQLQSLKEKFADGDLNEKEFVSLFREIIDASLSETQLTELFQKIDANSDGTVDWDELTNYMFLSGSDNSSEFIGDDANAFYETYQPEKLGETSMGSNGSVPGGAGGGLAQTSGASGASAGDTSGMRPIHNHKDLITRVLRLDKPYLYLTASKDGSIRTWNAHTLQLQNVLTTGKNWVTDCCVMRKSNRLAVTSMNRTLGVYDLSSNTLIGEVNEYSKRQAIPLCVEYVEKPADDREALVIGDDTGGIAVMTCSDLWMACDGRSTSSTANAAVAPAMSSSSSSSSSTGSATASSPSGAVQINAAGSAMLEAQGFSSRVKFKKHTDWVTRVKWVNDIRAIVATSLDTNISIIDIDRMVVKFEYNCHKKGVFDLVWCSSTRLIASCGMERDISIWNPYSSQRAVATLRGHTSSVVQLVSDDDNYQIISVSSDNTFKVWDVRNHRCLQTWVDRYKSTDGSENRISALLFDPKHPCIVSATTHLTRWPFKMQNEEEDVGDEGKEKPMSIASYNGVFHQVVTAELSAESVVKTWSAETGDEICSFSSAHGQSPVTAISFDYPGRRLLTGSHDGATIKMWNFSNGALVKEYLKQEDSQTSLTKPSGLGGSVLLSSTAGVGGSSSLASDLSFLGLDEDGSDSDVEKKNADGSKKNPKSVPASVTLPKSPRKRKKVRDIMLLPPTFGVDMEGRKNASALSEYVELPSPTRTRLQPKSTRDASSTLRPVRSLEFPREPVTKSSSDNDRDICLATDPTPPNGDAPTSQGRTPRARRSSVSSSTVSAAVSAAALLETVSSTASDKGSKYCEKEVTNILDIERNLRVGMGDYICQRFVCSVGWDRSVYIWADKNDESEALPIHILPNPKTLASNPTKCHTMDVLVLVYIPPAYIATAGLDGAILLWSINSGDFLSRVYQSVGSIDTMFYAQKIEMLFASGEAGQLVCIDRSMAPRAVLKLEHPNSEAVTATRCDRTNSHLVTGDVMGYIKVWDLTISSDHEGVVLDVCGLWCVPGPQARILGLDFVEHVRLPEPFLLVSSGNGDVSLWTLDGVQVGCFGKHRSWVLGRPSTYLSNVSSCIRSTTSSGQSRSPAEGDDSSAPSESVSPAEFLATLTKPQFIPCFSIAALNGNETARDTFLLEDSMPKPGEVWVCVSGHRTSRTANFNVKKLGDASLEGTCTGDTDSIPTDTLSAECQGSSRGDRSEGRASTIIPAMFRRSSNNSKEGNSAFMQVAGAVVMRETLASLPFLHQRLVDVAADITEIITVVKVTRGEISCWDGNGHKPPLLRVIEMSDFVRKAGWVKQSLLTQYVGRIFTEDQNNFQVNGMSLMPMDPNKPDRKSFLLIDTNGQDHEIRPLNESVSTARVKMQAQPPVHIHPSPSHAAPNTYKQGAGPRKRLSAIPTASVSRTETSGSKISNEPVENEEAHRVDFSAPLPPAVNHGLATLTTSVTSAHTFPLIKPKERRVMGGLLPKRSSVRMRHDQSVDFRRIHAPEEVPKSFRTALNQRLQSASVFATTSSSATNNNPVNATRGGYHNESVDEV